MLENISCSSGSSEVIGNVKVKYEITEASKTIPQSIIKTEQQYNVKTNDIWVTWPILFKKKNCVIELISVKYNNVPNNYILNTFFFQEWRTEF